MNFTAPTQVLTLNHQIDYYQNMKPRKPAHNETTAASFYEAIELINTAQEARAFFEDLCSPAEIQAMIDRWQVVDELQQHKSYREISKETGVSVTTVGRVARSLEMGTGGYKLIYGRKKAAQSDG